MVKKFLLLFSLFVCSPFQAQLFSNAPTSTYNLDTHFSCYFTSPSCEPMSEVPCYGSNGSAFGHWIFDPLDPPKICHDSNNGMIGNYCSLERTVENGSIVSDQYLKFYLNGMGPGSKDLTFMCANLGSQSGFEGDYSVRLVVQIGSDKHYVEIPPFVNQLQWFPVEIVFCSGTASSVEVQVFLETPHEQETASARVGLDIFFADKSRNNINCDSICPDCSSLLLEPNEEYILSAWVKQTHTADYDYATVITPSYSDVYISVNYSESNYYIEQIGEPSGAIIDGWQRIVLPFKSETDYVQDMELKIRLHNNSGYLTFFDDIRIHPMNSNLKSFVYDQNSQKLLAELDENNYATFYEYDGEGGLARIKKETEKGVFTIQETRSSNKKRPQK